MVPVLLALLLALLLPLLLPLLLGLLLLGVLLLACELLLEFEGFPVLEKTGVLVLIAVNAGEDR